MSLILSSENKSKITRNKSTISNPSFLNESITIQQNRAPFNSKLEKFFNISQDKNEELGPGSYYHPKQRSFIKSSFKKKTSSIEEINKNELYNMALFKIVKTKRYIKLNAQKSLIIDKENKEQVYNINNYSNINNTNTYNNNSNNNRSTSLDDNKKNYKLIPTTLTKNRINSIPSKEQYLGYDFDKNGIPIIIDTDLKIELNQNKKENNKFKLNSKQRNNKAIDWSKMSKKNISIENNSNTNINNNEYTTKENTSNINNNLTDEKNDLTINSDTPILKAKKQAPTRNKVDSSTSKTNTNEKNSSSPSKIFKSMNILNPPKPTHGGRRYRYNLPEINSFLYQKRKKSLEEFVYENIFNSEPGPGYYQSDSTFDKYNEYKYRKNNYNFGSNTKRSNNFLNSENSVNLGPGSYFKEKYKKLIYPDFFPFSRKESSINIKKYEKDLERENLGPGKYEIKSQFDKTQLYYCGPLEKRFFDNNKKIKLGPGEYLPLYDWSKKNNNEKEENLINKDINKIKRIKEINGRDSYIIKNENPEAGEYNPHIVKSIYYDMLMKENKLSNIKIPFYSKQDRFMKKSQSTSDTLGPGRYFPNDKNIGTNIFKKEKNVGLYLINGNNNGELKEKYSKLKAELESKLGPGSYDLHNINDWHKKSFNANSFQV